ncbi:MAG: UDP-N-acetylmuramoyl-L-alanyl-D-glutamate--2,6-diaminopimelate ligase [Holosporaceae bacterium]|jgi:UDP-N-acetylmuramoyl-L-alanyl-D-glutamate--2,6-diaminopimelate ligase|nr:UDP-N-acetylmuramoyl-L-alanyl-D-glutamate--2,6-diaminopimelate ligase [Holosporaceae bacterium]
MKKLGELFENVDDYKNEIVQDICDNSKTASVGSLFVALTRDEESGRKYIEEAIARGAKYILQESEDEKERVENKNGVVLFFVKNVRAELARVASKFYESRFNKIVAVTGTNGKSSTVDILRQIWINAGIDAASVGTLGVITKNGRANLSHDMTSPDCVELRKILWRLSENGVKNVAMETTAHGIAQRRIDEIKFDVCAFTNFSQDHLDYFKTFENYWNAKARLFLELASRQSVFVVNADDPKSEKICEIAAARGIKCASYGRTSNDVKIIDIEQEESTQRVKASFFGKEISFVLPLQGAFQVYNSLCAAEIAYLAGTNIEEIIDGIQKLHPINGRMELVARYRSAAIYIDYAHTPDALKNALISLRNHAKNRIIAVFGCGGNRDEQKRKLMGEIAKEFADVAIVTDDNPRDEDPARIRKAILEGCPQAIEIGNRRKAIESAIEMSSAGDAALIAGKGHETYQKIGKKILEFSDREVILNKVKNNVF